MNPKTGMSFLRPPTEEALPTLMPFVKEGEEVPKSSNMVIIFSCWNTMVGSAMVSLPWSFQNSGVALGILISFTSFVISFYTCSLIIKTAKTDKDYIFTLKKYYGNFGYYIGLIGPTILIFGAITVYFVVIVQSAYPLILVLCNKGFGMNLNYVDPNAALYYNFSTLSASWIALIEYFKLVSLSMKKDLSVFMRMGFLGAVCVLSMITFVVIYGFISMGNTTYEFKTTPGDSETKGLLWQDP